MATIFCKCSKCGRMESDDRSMNLRFAGRIYWLCMECTSPVLDYILEGAELSTEAIDALAETLEQYPATSAEIANAMKEAGK